MKTVETRAKEARQGDTNLFGFLWKTYPGSMAVIFIAALAGVILGLT